MIYRDTRGSCFINNIIYDIFLTNIHDWGYLVHDVFYTNIHDIYDIYI